MKYRITCTRCGREYELSGDLPPKFCPVCGGAAKLVKSKARVRAEEAMVKLEKLSPKVEEAYEWWLAAIVEYEDELQVLRQYEKRGVLSRSELEPYSSKKFRRVSLNEALKEYRAKKREVSV